MADVDYFRDVIYLIGLLIVIAIPIAAYFLFRSIFTMACDCVEDEDGVKCAKCTPKKGRPPACKSDGSNIENCTVCLWSKIACQTEQTWDLLSRLPACGLNPKCLCSQDDDKAAENCESTLNNIKWGLIGGAGGLLLLILIAIVFRIRKFASNKKEGGHSIGFKDRLVSVLTASRDANVWVDDAKEALKDQIKKLDSIMEKIKNDPSKEALLQDIQQRRGALDKSMKTLEKTRKALFYSDLKDQAYTMSPSAAGRDLAAESFQFRAAAQSYISAVKVLSKKSIKDADYKTAEQKQREARQEFDEKQSALEKALEEAKGTPIET